MNILKLFGVHTSLRPRSFAHVFSNRTGHGPAAKSAAGLQAEVLSKLAHAWVRGLPVPSRPLELCNVYPRVANRIARCWKDLAATEAVLDDLLVDHRRGRKGFPRQIVIELLRLQALHEERSVRGAGSVRLEFTGTDFPKTIPDGLS